MSHHRPSETPGFWRKLGYALPFALRFPLTPEVHERLRRLLDARRAGEPESDEMHQEANSLSRLLIGS
jgi:hypothetical protein